MTKFVGIASVTVLVTLALAPNGDAVKHRGRPARQSTHTLAARVPTARPAPTRGTPRSLLALCRTNDLLRPLCPGRVPASGSGPPATPGLYCQTRNPRQTVRQTRIAFAGGRCLYAEWDYEAGGGLRGLNPNEPVQGWDGRHWVPDEFSMFPPPLHVGVQIAASRRSFPDLTLGSDRWPQGSHRSTDGLLAPSHAAVSLGWVNWFGHDGQLVLTPWGPCETGTELVLYLPPNAQGVSYTITLDAWMQALRFGGKATHRMLRFQPGPALPHVIATLKALVGSAFTARGTAGSRR